MITVCREHRPWLAIGSYLDREMSSGRIGQAKLERRFAKVLYWVPLAALSASAS